MKKSFIIAAISFTSFLLLSSTASAQLAQSATGAAQGISTFANLITLFTEQIITALGTFFLSAGVVAFFYGVVQYIWGLRQGDLTKTKNGNNFMIWGLVGLFTMFSVYGIIKLAQSIIPGLSDTNITIPKINFNNGGTGSPTNPLNSGYTCTANRPCAGGAGTCNSAGNSCIAAGGTPISGVGAPPVSGGGPVGGGGGIGGFTCTPGERCGGESGTCNSGGNYCTPDSFNSGGVVTPPPTSGCTYDEFGTQICAPGANPSNSSGAAVGADCKFTGNAGCATGYCDSATDVCDYPPVTP